MKGVAKLIGLLVCLTATSQAWAYQVLDVPQKIASQIRVFSLPVVDDQADSVGRMHVLNARDREGNSWVTTVTVKVNKNLLRVNHCREDELPPPLPNKLCTRYEIHLKVMPGHRVAKVFLVPQASVVQQVINDTGQVLHASPKFSVEQLINYLVGHLYYSNQSKKQRVTFIRSSLKHLRHKLDRRASHVGSKLDFSLVERKRSDEGVQLASHSRVERHTQVRLLYQLTPTKNNTVKVVATCYYRHHLAPYPVPQQQKRKYDHYPIELCNIQFDSVAQLLRDLAASDLSIIQKYLPSKRHHLSTMRFGVDAF